MIPLQKMTAEHSHLLWKDLSGVEQCYEYKQGYGITFGSSFMHSTQPRHEPDAALPACFLCFNYGTVECGEEWDDINGSLPLGGIEFTKQRIGELGILTKDSKRHDLSGADVLIEMMPDDVETTADELIDTLKQLIPDVDWQSVHAEPIGYGIELFNIRCNVPAGIEQEDFEGKCEAVELVQSIQVKMWTAVEAVNATFKM